MAVRDFISDFYPKVNPYEGIHFIEEKLVENEYLVVTDTNGYVGILTPLDLIERPHKIVADCLTAKEYIVTDDTILSVFNKLK